MTEFEKKSFSVYQQGDDTYRSNWDAIFAKRPIADDLDELDRAALAKRREPPLRGHDFTEPVAPITTAGRAELLEIIAQQRARIAALEEGLAIKGWFCKGCKVFTGCEKEELTECRSCGKPRSYNP